MKRFGIVAVLVAIFIQTESESSKGTIIKLGKFIEDDLLQRIQCAVRLGEEKVSQLPKTDDKNMEQMEQLPENNTALNENFDCIWKKKGIISENAVLNEDKLEEYYIALFPMRRMTGSRGREAAHDAVQICKNVLGNDSGQRAVKIQNCITKIIKKLTI